MLWLVVGSSNDGFGLAEARGSGIVSLRTQGRGSRLFRTVVIPGLSLVSVK